MRAEQLESIQIGSTALAHWPYRFLTDPGAGDTPRLSNQVTAAGKALAVTAASPTPGSWTPHVRDADA